MCCFGYEEASAFSRKARQVADRKAHKMKLRNAGGDGARSPSHEISGAFAEVQTHFGEFLQGAFYTDEGPMRALVTVPCSAFRSKVVVVLNATKDIRTEPAGLQKAAAAAKLTLAYLGAPGCGATIRIDSNIQQGVGAGSSTGDVVATILATARALHQHLRDGEVAMLTVETEKAADPTMFVSEPDRVRLFAHRMGMTLEVFDGGLPTIELVGILDGSAVDTLTHPPATYSKPTIHEFDTLRDGMRSAISMRDAGRLGGISTRSAEINEGFLPKPRFRVWMELFQRHGAVGIAVSHSGSAVSFLFDGHDANRATRIENLLADLAGLGVSPFVRYSLGPASGAAS